MPNIGKRSALSSHNNYTSIDSHSSSSSDDDEAVPPSTSSSPLHAYSLYRQYSKRLFKDSTSNLKDLESTYTSLNHPDRILSPSSAAVAAAALAHPHEHLTDPSFSAEIYEDSNNNVSPKYIELLKIEFFILGFVIGAAIQMFCVSIILMFVSYSQHSGPLIELSHEYYPVFRCMFFVSFFFTLYGGNLFLWRRAKIEYRSVLGVGSSHTYRKLLYSSLLILIPYRICSTWCFYISFNHVYLLYALCPYHHWGIGKSEC